MTEASRLRAEAAEATQKVRDRQGRRRFLLLPEDTPQLLADVETLLAVVDFLANPDAPRYSERGTSAGTAAATGDKSTT